MKIKVIAIFLVYFALYLREPFAQMRLKSRRPTRNKPSSRSGKLEFLHPFHGSPTHTALLCTHSRILQQSYWDCSASHPIHHYY